MTIRLYESPDGPVIGKDSAEYRYTIEGTELELEARTALLAGSAVTITVSGTTLVRQDARVELQDDAIDIWQGVVPYGERERKETGESSYQFDTGGGTHHLTHSLHTTAYAPAGKAAPDCKGAIGWDGQNVAGVDITTPIYHFSETHYLSVAVVTEAYKTLLFNLTGKVCNGVFREKAKGEVLFCGAAGSQRGEEDWEITFKFAASPNAINIPVGDIVVLEKEGWEYLWVRYRQKDDAVAEDIVPEPVGAYVEQVYEYGDFSLIGIGA
jgi:hypothetical protein